jgi:hypothetical protein
MELDEMKSLWGSLSDATERQEKIKKEELMKLTKRNYQRKLGKIYLPEILGTVITFLYAGFFISQFDKLEFKVNQILTIFNTSAMILLPIISLISLYRLNRLDISENSPMELVAKFKKDKVFFWKFQRMNMLLSGFFAISILPPLAELVGKRDLILEPQFWMVYVPVGLICVYFFSKITFRKYEKSLEEAEQLIEGID